METTQKENESNVGLPAFFDSVTLPSQPLMNNLPVVRRAVPTRLNHPPQQTVSQAIAYFTAFLKDTIKPGNYPRIARTYVLFCLQNEYGYDLISLRLFASGKAASQASAVRKFMVWHQSAGYPTILPDAPMTGCRTPAYNELILRYLAKADTLQGDESKATYTKALNAYFRYLDDEQTAGRNSQFSGMTIRGFVTSLHQREVSPFTIRLYLSTVKQLAKWVITNQDKDELNPGLIEALLDVANVKAPKGTVRRYYKESLNNQQRQVLLDSIDDKQHQVLVSLMAWGGLRTVELTRLRRGDVELRESRLWVKGKGHQDRMDIRLPTLCADLLTDYLNQRCYWPKALAMDPFKPLTNNLLLFESLSTRVVRRLVHQYLVDAKLDGPRLSAHSLRHTAAQRLLGDGLDPVHVQRHLRHKTFESTLVYVRKQTDEDYYEQISSSEANR